MSRFKNNNEKGSWGAQRQEAFPNGFSRRPNFYGRCNGGGFGRQTVHDLELETRPTDELHNDDPVIGKLDRVLEKLEKIDLWRDETDRRFKGLDPNLKREIEPPLGFDDGADGEFEDFRRRGTADRGLRYRNPNSRASPKSSALGSSAV